MLQRWPILFKFTYVLKGLFYVLRTSRQTLVVISNRPTLVGRLQYYHLMLFVKFVDDILI